MSDWVDTIHSIVTLSPAASQWLTEFLSSEDGLKYVKPFLVESGARDVRTNFSQLLDKCLASQASHAAGSQAAAAIIQHIVSLLSAEGGVGDNVKYSSQYFWLLSMFAQMVGDKSSMNNEYEQFLLPLYSGCQPVSAAFRSGNV